MTQHRSISAACMCAALAACGTAVADGGRTASAWAGSAALAGEWSGTASSTTDRSFTFPVTATVVVAATGRPTGAMRLGPPVDCAGSWAPVQRTGRVFRFAESIVARAGTTCIDDGTARLSAASGGRLRYVWSKGDAGSVAYLRPIGISGRWVGTITQDGLGTIRARLRVVGVRPGQMPGASDYSAPLSCGGDLIPVARGTQRRAVFDEEITRSSNPNCIGSGTTTLTMRRDGRLSYRWTGGGAVSTGLLRRAG